MNPIHENALVLVAILPDPKDFEIARMLGWYRIPLKYAPKLVEVDYLAFYQGNNFGVDHRWKIEYVAEYRGHELTTRGELFREELDHPRSKEEYFKIQIGPLFALQKPVRAEKWKRITFVYTTGGLLNRASILNDLIVKAEEREILWKNLRERNRVNSIYRAGSNETEMIDPWILQMILGLTDLAMLGELEDGQPDM